MKFTVPASTDLTKAPDVFNFEFESGYAYGNYTPNYVNLLIADEDRGWKTTLPEWHALFKMLAEQMTKEGLDINAWRMWSGETVMFSEGDESAVFDFARDDDENGDDNFDVEIALEDGNWVLTVFAQDEDEEWIGEDAESIQDVIDMWTYEFED